MSGGLDWGRAVALIEQADEVCLACHVSPDGDALGSMLAFGLGLRRRGVRCTASFGDPFVVPSILRFLPGQELLVEPAGYPVDPDLMLTFDAASAERLGSLAPHAEKARELIVLDHHASNTGAAGAFGTVRLVDPAAAATAVLTEELLTRLGVEPTPDIALNLYAGLASDTGSFKFASTTPAVHTLAARLLTAGVRPDAVGRELWDRAPFGYLQVLSAALGRARLEPDAVGGMGLVWTTVTKADRVANSVSFDQVESIIDVVKRTDEAEVAVVFKEMDDGGWYVSTRSKGRVDLSRVCLALSGGGNPEMAGFLWTGPVSAAIDRLLALLSSRSLP
ncbi:DHH family phosphoesterase [Actinomadura scrupuli]|uniref:DHH family phosphoesterase n=1 Tax=Actinomadura scrupuli TaxID=559629 RepID=UPI003D9726ED